MDRVFRGTVNAGRIVLSEPLGVADGTEVFVSVVPTAVAVRRLSPEEFMALPVFGMHRDDSDRRDGVEIINEERAKWGQRPHRQD